MKATIKEQLEDHMMVMDGYDDCILGIAERCGDPNVLAYDTVKIIKKLMKEGMSYDEAWEWFSFNQVGAYVGEGTPVFIHKL
jgi:hypothetical protein